MTTTPTIPASIARRLSAVFGDPSPARRQSSAKLLGIALGSYPPLLAYRDCWQPWATAIGKRPTGIQFGPCAVSRDIRPAIARLAGVLGLMWEVDGIAADIGGGEWGGEQVVTWWLVEDGSSRPVSELRRHSGIATPEKRY